MRTLMGKRGIGGVEEWDGGALNNFTKKSSFNLILKDVSALLSRRHTEHSKDGAILARPEYLDGELIDRKHLREQNKQGKT